jgi:GTPase SAR1 family protein
MDAKIREVNNIWELYGLHMSPFSTSPLLVKGGLIPTESFIGRKEELKHLLKMFGSEGGSRTLVCGDVGVGKTTLVNMARANIIEKGFFSPIKELGIQDSWGSTQFVLNTLYAIYATIKLMPKKPISADTYRKLQKLLDFDNRVVSGANITFGLVGGGVSRDETPPAMIPNASLIDFFVDVIKEIKEYTHNDIVIHYNNLENLKENMIRRLFEDLRDFFQTPNVHFVFVGNLTIYSIFQSMPRFSSIISSTPVILRDLTLDEIKQIIRIRIEYLRISKELKFIVPFDDDTLAVLYELYSGNIRSILNSLDTAITFATDERPIVLDKFSLANILKQVVEKTYLSQLQPKPREVLMVAVKYQEITNRQLNDLTKMARSNISTYTSILERNGCMYVRRKDGKDKYWSVEPKIKWLLLESPDPHQPILKAYTKEFE